MDASDDAKRRRLPSARRTSRCCSTACSRCSRPRWPTGRRSSSTRRSASAVTPKRCSPRIPAAHPGRARPRSGGAGAQPRATGPLRRAYPPRPRRLRPDARGARRARTCRASTGCCSTSVSRRCNSTSPNAASPTRRTRRWTCAWTRRPGGPLPQVVNTYPVPELARVLREYGEERFACASRRPSTGPAGRRR